jgi:hypothetical protein
MKIDEIPDTALNATPTPIPTKMMYDWYALYKTLQEHGFVVIESDQLRTMPSGGVESVLVKMFNSYLRQTIGVRLKTKRISANRWYCTI